MKDPLDIARNAAAEAIGEGTRKDQRDRPSEVTWLQRAQAFAFISIAESLREIIEWAAIGDDSDAAVVLGASIASRTPVTVTDDEPPTKAEIDRCGYSEDPFHRCRVCYDYAAEREREAADIAFDRMHPDPYAATPAEPLVMCGEPDGDSEPCRLLPGHEGGHLAYFPVDRHPEDPEPEPPISPRPYVPVPEFLP